jgi:hypothetical protein
MTEVYLLQRNDGYYLSKHQDWVDGSHANELYRASHKDDAINTKVELTVKEPLLRLKIISCDLTERGVLCLPAQQEQCEQS